MALGGGTFLTQNKTLPGAYLNFVSAAKATAAISDRGVAAMGVELDWGTEGQVFTVTPKELRGDSVKLFGYEYGDEKLKGLRDLFSGVKQAYLYRLNGGGAKAKSDLATARYSGVKGNDITVAVTANADESAAFDVRTLMGSKVVDQQTVKTAAELKDNDFVVWSTTATLTATAGVKLAGGSNKAAVTGEDYQSFLNLLESKSFNTLGCVATDEATKQLFIQFTKRMRDQIGVKFQTVLYRAAADYEGVISVENQTTDKGLAESAAVYWVTGAQAGCAVNRSLLNRRYDGECTVAVSMTQSQLETALQAGKFLFHQVGEEIRVLGDVNTFVTFTVTRSGDFQSNQTVRVLDQIANDTAALFNSKYLGKVPNDNAGRTGFWNDVVKYHRQLQRISAIENFKAEDVTVEAGVTKKAVAVTERVTPVNAMEQLYMTVVVE